MAMFALVLLGLGVGILGTAEGTVLSFGHLATASGGLLICGVALLFLYGTMRGAVDSFTKRIGWQAQGHCTAFFRQELVERIRH